MSRLSSLFRSRSIPSLPLSRHLNPVSSISHQIPAYHYTKFLQLHNRQFASSASSDSNSSKFKSSDSNSSTRNTLPTRSVSERNSSEVNAAEDAEEEIDEDEEEMDEDEEDLLESAALKSEHEIDLGPLEAEEFIMSVEYREHAKMEIRKKLAEAMGDEITPEELAAPELDDETAIIDAHLDELLDSLIDGSGLSADGRATMVLDKKLRDVEVDFEALKPELKDTGFDKKDEEAIDFDEGSDRVELDEQVDEETGEDGEDGDEMSADDEAALEEEHDEEAEQSELERAQYHEELDAADEEAFLEEQGEDGENDEDGEENASEDGEEDADEDDDVDEGALPVNSQTGEYEIPAESNAVSLSDADLDAVEYIPPQIDRRTGEYAYPFIPILKNQAEASRTSERHLYLHFERVNSTAQFLIDEKIRHRLKTMRTPRNLFDIKFNWIKKPKATHLYAKDGKIQFRSPMNLPAFMSPNGSISPKAISLSHRWLTRVLNLVTHELNLNATLSQYDKEKILKLAIKACRRAMDKMSNDKINGFHRILPGPNALPVGPKKDKRLRVARQNINRMIRLQATAKSIREQQDSAKQRTSKS